MTQKAIADLKAVKKWQDQLYKYFDSIIEDMHMIKGYVFNNSMDNDIRYPINLFRLINNAKKLFNLQSISVSDLNPILLIE